VVSGGIYVPLEIYELLSGFTWIKVCTLAINICIVVYMTYVLRQTYRNGSPAQARAASEQP
jgi:uncharacterized membrane protein (DUF2068 family)